MQNIFRALFMAMSIGLFITRPASSYADWQGHDDDKHDHDGKHDHDDKHDHDRGHGHSYIGIGFSVWPDNYYYGAPYYPPADDVFVSSPVYQPVVINGTIYYLNNGTYYIYNGYGYQAVAPPVVVVQPPVVVDSPANTNDTTDSITINIPNDKGGYTAVTLKRSGNGFIGPQGEFYPNFPSVNQLRTIYGK